MGGVEQVVSEQDVAGVRERAREQTAHPPPRQKTGYRELVSATARKHIELLMERKAHAALITADPQVEVYAEGAALREKARLVKDALAVLAPKPHTLVPKSIGLEVAVAPARFVAVAPAELKEHLDQV